MSLSTREQKVLGALDGAYDGMLDLLRTLVNIESGSYNKAGVDAVVDTLRRHLEAHGVSCDSTRTTSTEAACAPPSTARRGRRRIPCC